MLGWGLMGILLLPLIIWLVIEIAREEVEYSPIWLFLTIILFASIGCFTYYNDKIYIPENYKTINIKIGKVKAIITNKELNLADVEMNKSLAELIVEKEDILFQVRVNNISPWALFKIYLEKEGTDVVTSK